MFLFIMILFGFLAGGACSKKIERPPTQNFKARMEEVTAVGIGRAEIGIENPQKRKRSSYLKARKMAEEELSNILGNLTLMDSRPLKAKLAEDAKLRKKFSKLIRKAEEVEKNWIGSEGCSLKLRMNKNYLAKKLAVTFKR